MRIARHIVVAVCVRALALALALAASASASACSGGEGDDDDDDDVTDDDDDSACTAAGFADEATELALPPGYVASAFLTLASEATCGEAGRPSYVLADLTGDDVADLVVTRLCGDESVGDARWLVHRGGAGGFADEPFDWALPSGYASSVFRTTAAEATCGEAGTPSFLTIDLDGEGGLDLVVTRLCGDAAVGTSEWLVHRGGAGGFADEPVAWPLPSGYADAAFTTSARVATCGEAGTPSHALVDATGDGRGDLLISRLCGDATVGDARWLVHPAVCGP